MIVRWLATAVRSAFGRRWPDVDESAAGLPEDWFTVYCRAHLEYVDDEQQHDGRQAGAASGDGIGWRRPNCDPAIPDTPRPI